MTDLTGNSLKVGTDLKELLRNGSKTDLLLCIIFKKGTKIVVGLG
jgi:hypothetical protein